MKRQPFFDPVAAITVSTARCLSEISFCNPTFLTPSTATFSEWRQRALHRRDFHAEQRIWNVHKTSEYVLDREQFYVESTIDIVCEKKRAPDSCQHPSTRFFLNQIMIRNRRGTQGSAEAYTNHCPSHLSAE
jgi:hypothetical protein